MLNFLKKLFGAYDALEATIKAFEKHTTALDAHIQTTADSIAAKKAQITRLSEEVGDATDTIARATALKTNIENLIGKN